MPSHSKPVSIRIWPKENTTISCRTRERSRSPAGYTSGATSHHGILAESVMLLGQRFTGDMLARTMSEALDGLAAE